MAFRGVRKGDCSGPRLVVMGAVLLFVLSACGGAEIVREAPRFVPEAEPEPVSQISAGGTAEVVLPASGDEPPACLNPYLPECHGSEALLGVALEGALAAGPRGEHRPILAGEVPSFASGTAEAAPFAVEYRLRAGARFSDGRPVTSADARATYEEAARLAREEGDAAPYPGFARLESVETPDRRTVRLVFREPYAAWRELLSAPILQAGEASSRNPTGSGPFLAPSRTTDALTFRRNDRYWPTAEPPSPRLDALVVRYGGTEGSHLAPLTPGKAPPPDAYVSRADPARLVALLPNARRGAMAEPEARSAVAGISAPLRGRLASLAGGRAVRGTEGLDDTGPPEDPGRLDLVYSEDEPWRAEAARLLVQALEGEGVEATARAVPRAELHAETLPRGEFDLALVDLRTPADYERLSASLPPDSREALAGALEEGALAGDGGKPYVGVREVLLREAALVPLFRASDAYRWSSELSGPRRHTAPDALLANVREWGFYR